MGEEKAAGSGNWLLDMLGGPPPGETSKMNAQGMQGDLASLVAALSQSRGGASDPGALQNMALLSLFQ